MKQLMELTVLQIKGRLLAEVKSQGETESLSLCHLRHLWSSWLQLLVWNTRKHLVYIFSSPFCLFNKSLAESCRRQRDLPFQGWGWNLQGCLVFFFFLHVSMTDGKCFQGKSAQVAAKYSMCKCTWQTQDKKIHRPLARELPYFAHLQARISLFW